MSFVDFFAPKSAKTGDKAKEYNASRELKPFKANNKAGSKYAKGVQDH